MINCDTYFGFSGIIEPGKESVSVQEKGSLQKKVVSSNL